jgi:hypothetical protein
MGAGSSRAERLIRSQLPPARGRATGPLLEGLAWPALKPSEPQVFAEWRVRRLPLPPTLACAVEVQLGDSNVTHLAHPRWRFPTGYEISHGAALPTRFVQGLRHLEIPFLIAAMLSTALPPVTPLAATAQKKYCDHGYI